MKLDGLLLDSLKTTAGPLVIYNIIMLDIYIYIYIYIMVYSYVYIDIFKTLFS